MRSHIRPSVLNGILKNSKKKYLCKGVFDQVFEVHSKPVFEWQAVLEPLKVGPGLFPAASGQVMLASVVTHPRPYNFASVM
jgi:hypothetical protein